MPTDGVGRIVGAVGVGLDPHAPSIAERRSAEHHFAAEAFIGKANGYGGIAPNSQWSSSRVSSITRPEIPRADAAGRVQGSDTTVIIPSWRRSVFR